MKGVPKDRGFIRAIVVIALALVVLKFAFNIDALTVFDDPRFSPFFEKTVSWTMGVWEAYIYPAVGFVADYAVIAWQFAWKWTLIIMEKLKELGLKAYPEFLRFW